MRDARQRVVAVEHHVLGIDFGDRVEHVARRVGVGAGRQALEGHAFLQFGREQAARLQEHQLLVVVAEGFLRLQVQVDPVAGLVALQGLLDPGQQVVAAHQEFHRLSSTSSTSPSVSFSVQVRATTHCCVISIGELSHRSDGHHTNPSPARRPVAAPVHEAALAEEAAAGARRRARPAAAARRAANCSRWRRATRSSRAWSRSRGRAGACAAARSRAARCRRCQRPGWTLLVQGVDLHDDARA